MSRLDSYELQLQLRRRNLDKALALLDKADDLPEKDWSGRPLVAIPVVCSDERMGAVVLERLLARGCTANESPGHARSVLHLAAERGRSRLVPMLLAAGADPHARGTFQETPLHQAAGAKRDRIVRFLLEAGADPNARDEKGRTPAAYLLHVLRVFPQDDTQSLLLEGRTRRTLALLRHFGADLTLADATGVSPDALLRQRLSAHAYLDLLGAHDRSIRRIGPMPMAREAP